MENKHTSPLDAENNIPILWLLVVVSLLIFTFVIVPAYQINLDPRTTCTLFTIKDGKQEAVKYHCLGALVGVNKVCSCVGIKVIAR